MLYGYSLGLLLPHTKVIHFSRDGKYQDIRNGDLMIRIEHWPPSKKSFQTRRLLQTVWIFCWTAVIKNNIDTKKRLRRAFERWRR